MDSLLRISCFTMVLLLMLLWEGKSPKRTQPEKHARKWINLGFGALNALLLWVALPLLAIDVARLGEGEAWGVLRAMDWPFVLRFLFGFLALDLVIYWQHRLFHRIPFLWRFHRMHHSDTAFDTTTGLRFHPIEIILSMLIKIATIRIAGIPVEAVILFEIALNAASLFNHGNVALPAPVDRVLRRIIVTPDMHRVHHSTQLDEYDHNFSFTISLWDHLFGSYRRDTVADQRFMNIGLSVFRSEREQSFWQLLSQPFRS